ncbi:MAG: indole-3-glycerol-phosphate synthase [Nitrososphaerota archaeon]|nr:indole-3-glycerol-phosphate synthase [Nitrososphaerota archaeon]
MLASSAAERVRSGYYDAVGRRWPLRSMKRAIAACTATPVIAEIKFASPSAGAIGRKRDPAEVARACAEGGAVALSVLTEPEHFDGSLGNLSAAREAVDIPLLMKDIVVHPRQVEAARAVGADAVLLIASLHRRSLAERGLADMIRLAHSLGLEVLLEAHDGREFDEALASEADMVGINNRDLSTLQVDLGTSRELLKRKRGGKPVVCESGIGSPAEIRELVGLGADAFLVGSSVMRAPDTAGAVRRLVGP